MIVIRLVSNVITNSLLDCLGHHFKFIICPNNWQTDSNYVDNDLHTA